MIVKNIVNIIVNKTVIMVINIYYYLSNNNINNIGV